MQHGDRNGAKAGLVAPDDTTFAYLKGRQFAPTGEQWEQGVAYWRTLKSDADAQFDTIVTLDAADIAPQVTWGTNPGQVIAVNQIIPALSLSAIRSNVHQQRKP